jgi:hypothetical protein
MTFFSVGINSCQHWRVLENRHPPSMSHWQDLSSSVVLVVRSVLATSANDRRTTIRANGAANLHRTSSRRENRVR